jgi:photosystem II stability/assembly factor-like uncharacterized protein
MMKIFSLLIVSIFVFQFNIQAQKNKKTSVEDTIDVSLISGLKFRSIGPAMTSGRIADFAFNKENSSEYYIAVASGHIWKTTNNGTTFSPVFDNYGSYSIGCLKMDPKNHNVVWAGTGENNHQRALGYGDGIYKTVDGGKSWKNMGLKNSYHIGMIAIHPENTDIVYAACEGSAWGPNKDRGLYKTINGGKTWDSILFISENTGINNVVIHPENPDIIFATSEQRRRRVNTKIGGGPETALYKSTDGGESFRKITSGLPSEHMGGMGIAIAPSNPDIMYLIIEAANDAGGFFRSTDQGETWTKMSNHSASGQYYNEIYCDPLNENLVYSVETYSHYTEDGGKTWKRLGLDGRHVDDHALWIDPKNTQHLLIGGDGGVYESYDQGNSWLFKCNLPVTQFYRVAVDNDAPFYNVYGGTQDNNTLGGPSRNQSSYGITNEDWNATLGGDGFWPAVDPTNPNIIYSEYQYGNLYRIDKTSGAKQYIKPMPKKDELTFKWNWNAPFIISPHSNTRLYLAANKVFRSDDMGNTWTTISDDLTAKIDRDKWPVMDHYWSSEAVVKDVSTSLYGTIVSLDESTAKENLLYVGTDDGLIQMSEDGKNWTKAEEFPGVPKNTYVSDIKASHHNENIVFAAFDNRKRNDLKPYLLISEDKGKTWKSITSNLPENGTVHCIEQDFINPDLLFAGTEFGFFFSYDKGKKWYQFKNGLPTIPVRDIQIQNRENDIVIATFGRGIYILDNYSALREINKTLFEKDFHMFQIKDALLYSEIGGKYGQGSTFYKGDNPEYGVKFTYYLKEVPKTKKQTRKETEDELFKDKKPITHPTAEESRLEKLEEKPYILFTISNESEEIVKKIKHNASKGLHRIGWNLRQMGYYPAGANDDANNNYAFYALPGKYFLKMELIHNTNRTLLVEKEPFTIVPNKEFEIQPEDSDVLANYQKQIHELALSYNTTKKYLKELENKTKHIKNTFFLAGESNTDLIKEIKTIEKELSDIHFVVYGTPAKASWEEVPPEKASINLRMDYITSRVWESSGKITATEKENYKIVSEELPVVINKLKEIGTVKLKKIEDHLDQINAPWTPGREPKVE